VTPRAVVLVGGPAAPYSRSVRIARALAAEGFAVEIAAVAAPGLPNHETIDPGRPGAAGEPDPGIETRPPIELRRYAPSGPWRHMKITLRAKRGSDIAGVATRNRPVIQGDSIAGFDMSDVALLLSRNSNR